MSARKFFLNLPQNDVNLNDTPNTYTHNLDFLYKILNIEVGNPDLNKKNAISILNKGCSNISISFAQEKSIYSYRRRIWIVVAPI